MVACAVNGQIGLSPQEKLVALLEEDHVGMERLLDGLRYEEAPAVRACLAMEMVRRCCSVEDVRDRTVYKSLARPTSDAAVAHAGRCQDIRRLLGLVDGQTHRVLPGNVHMHNPQAFEGTLLELVMAVQHHLDTERSEVIPAAMKLSDEAATSLSAAIERARRNAMRRPHGSVGAIRRRMLRIVDRLHQIEDAPDYYQRDLRRALSEVS